MVYTDVHYMDSYTYNVKPQKSKTKKNIFLLTAFGDVRLFQAKTNIQLYLMVNTRCYYG